MRRVMMLATTVLIGLSANARDLVQMDIAMGCYDRTTNTSTVFPNGIDGRYFATWNNPRDSSGWRIYDRAYYVIATFQLEDGDTIETHLIDFIESSQRLRFVTPREYSTIWLSYGYKLRQNIDRVDTFEVRRFWTADIYDDYWPIYSTVFNMHNTADEYIERTQPYYNNVSGVMFLNWTPDTVIQCGVNPSRFHYWTCRYWLAPDAGDTLFVDPSHSVGCSWVFWTAEDGTDPDYPTDPRITVLQPDSRDILTYRATPELLSLSDGEYTVTLEHPVPFTFERETVDLGDYNPASRTDFVVTLTPMQCGTSNQVLVFRAGRAEYRYPLGGYDVQFPLEPRIVGGQYE
ncbi:hypothetical protein KKH27_03015 [bacterium]|nr:hypothetical protein [bacterium]